MLALRLLLALAACHVASTAYCSGAPDPGARVLDYPIDTLAPRFVRAVPNGELYEAGDARFGSTFWIAHVRGSPFKMGLAHGRLLTDEVS